MCHIPSYFASVSMSESIDDVVSPSKKYKGYAWVLSVADVNSEPAPVQGKREIKPPVRFGSDASCASSDVSSGVSSGVRRAKSGKRTRRDAGYAGNAADAADAAVWNPFTCCYDRF